MDNIILASSSPRRKELLNKIVNHFEIIPSKVDEIYPPSLEKFEVSLYLSNLKAYDIYQKYPNHIVIGVDTTVIINDDILGKPLNKDEAKKMLEKLSGNMHHVITGVTVYKDNTKYEINSINKVYFKNLDSLTIDNYLLDDEYKDKAGSYAIQGKAGAFIEKIDGDYDSIVGLPTKELYELLLKLNNTK